MSFIFKIITIGTLAGALSGFFSTLFLKSLYYVTDLRVSNPYIILLLPVFGLFLAYLSKNIPLNVDVSIKDIKSHLNQNKVFTSTLVTPFVFLASLGTHLFGGSAGREGVGVIMGASLSSRVGTLFRLDYKISKTLLLYSGVAAGFSSIFGAPIAAIIFAYEIDRFKRIKERSLFLIVVTSSIVSYYTTRLLNLKHYTPDVSFNISYQIIIYILISGVTCGAGALAYFHAIRLYKKYTLTFFKNVYLRYFFGCVVIVATIFLFNAFDYAGIGTTFINDSFLERRSFYDFLLKFILTTLTLGIGFKGGEVTPLLFMGSTLSNSMLSQFGYSHFALSSALGMFAFFGAATATPLTSTLMALDLFGPELALICLPTCFIARFIMNKESLY